MYVKLAQGLHIIRAGRIPRQHKLLKINKCPLLTFSSILQVHVTLPVIKGTLCKSVKISQSSHILTEQN